MTATGSRGHAERRLHRTWFTAGAVYCNARSAEMGGKTDEIICAEVNRAFDRQRAAMARRP